MRLNLNDYLTAVAFSEGKWGSGDVRYYLPDNVGILFPEDFVHQSGIDLERFEGLMGEDTLEELIAEYGDIEKVAYDIWFTRNHHGVGFWEQNSEARKKAEWASQQLKKVEYVEFTPIAEEYFVEVI